MTQFKRNDKSHDKDKYHNFMVKINEDKPSKFRQQRKIIDMSKIRRLEKNFRGNVVVD